MDLLRVEFSEEQHFGFSGPLSSPRPCTPLLYFGKMPVPEGGLVGGLVPQAEQTLLISVMC